MIHSMRNFFHVIIISCYLFLSGCVAAAVPVVAGLAVAGTVAGIVTIVNLARDQYPDIDFDTQAPIETVYNNSYNDVWNAIIDTLMEMKESTSMMDKNSGVIRTAKKNLNDVSWIGKGLGKATFLYEYNITVRTKSKGVSVELMVPFWEEKAFVAAKEKNIPEGSNMMRHIFYRNLNKRINPVAVRLPDSPMQDIRHAPITKETQPKAPLTTQPLPQIKQKSDTEDTVKQHEDYLTGKIKKSASSVKVRAVPLSKDDATIAILKGGAEIELLEEKGDWVKIRFMDNNNKEKEGWINKYSVEGYNE